MKNAIKDVLLLFKTRKSISLTFMAKSQHTQKHLISQKKLPGRQKLGILVLKESKESETLLFKQPISMNTPFPSQKTNGYSLTPLDVR